MVTRMGMSDDAQAMSDLPVILLLLGATIVPWFLYAFAFSGRRAATDGAHPGQSPAAAPVSRAGQQDPDGTPRSDALLQLRPDGVVLDWRSEPPGPRIQAPSEGAVTDTSPPS